MACSALALFEQLNAGMTSCLVLTDAAGGHGARRRAGAAARVCVRHFGGLPRCARGARSVHTRPSLCSHAASHSRLARTAAAVAPAAAKIEAADCGFAGRGQQGASPGLLGYVARLFTSATAAALLRRPRGRTRDAPDLWWVRAFARGLHHQPVLCPGAPLRIHPAPNSYPPSYPPLPQGVLTGKLDQRRACVDVSWSLGRDIKPGQLSQMVAQLCEWSSQCDATVSQLDGRVKWANTNAAEKACERLALNLQLENVKKGVKMEAEVRGGGEGAPPQFDKGSEGSQMAEEDRLGAGRTKRCVSECAVDRAKACARPQQLTRVRCCCAGGAEALSELREAQEANN